MFCTLFLSLSNPSFVIKKLDEFLKRMWNEIGKEEIAIVAVPDPTRCWSSSLDSSRPAIIRIRYKTTEGKGRGRGGKTIGRGVFA
jgi:hypothetical protein